MANPQVEDGYLRISNEFWAALTKFKLPPDAMRVYMAIIAHTWGWRRKKGHIPLSVLSSSVGIAKSNVIRAEHVLVATRCLLVDGEGYTVNKDYETWVPLQKRTTPNRSKKTVDNFKKEDFPVIVHDNKPLSSTITPVIVHDNKPLSSTITAYSTLFKDKEDNIKTKAVDPTDQASPAAVDNSIDLKQKYSRIAKQIYDTGTNIYQIVAKLQKKRDIPRKMVFEVMIDVCESYLAGTEKIDDAYAWFLRAITERHRKWQAGRSIAEADEYKRAEIADNKRGGTVSIGALLSEFKQA